MNYVLFILKEFDNRLTKTVLTLFFNVNANPFNRNKYWFGYLFTQHLSASFCAKPCSKTCGEYSDKSDKDSAHSNITVNLGG